MAVIVTFLFHLFPFYIFHIQESSAVTDVFVKTGDDVILNLTAEITADSRIWTWQFEKVVLVEFISGSMQIVNNRSGKVEVLEKSCSVKLKDLQKSHSGIYTAKAISPEAQTLTQYNVSVLDPVSPVDLTFTCASRSSSSSYNLTATCSADDSSISITLRCENQTCDQEGGERRSVTKSGSSLHIYRLNKSIVCSHGNQISRNESIKQIENHCTNTNNEPRKHYWYIILILLVLLPPIVYILCRSLKKTGDKSNFDNTIYALPVVNNQAETVNETAEDDVRNPTTTYSTVGHSLSKGATKTRGNDQPESLYSQVKAV